MQLQRALAAERVTDSNRGEEPGATKRVRLVTSSAVKIIAWSESTDTAQTVMRINDVIGAAVTGLAATKVGTPFTTDRLAIAGKDASGNLAIALWDWNSQTGFAPGCHSRTSPTEIRSPTSAIARRRTRTRTRTSASPPAGLDQLRSDVLSRRQVRETRTRFARSRQKIVGQALRMLPMGTWGSPPAGSVTRRRTTPTCTAARPVRTRRSAPPSSARPTSRSTAGPPSAATTTASTPPAAAPTCGSRGTAPRPSSSTASTPSARTTSPSTAAASAR